MYSYLLLIVKYYPYFYYLMTIYDCFGYLNVAKKIYQYIYNKLNPTKEKEIDEIYEMIMETTPGEVEVIIHNDTNYVKYNEEHKIIKENWYEVKI